MKTTLVTLLWAFLWSLVAAQQTTRNFDPYELYSFDIRKPYLNKEFSNADFDFGGDTIIRNDKYIRLTQAKPDQRGWFFSKAPLRLPAFQIEFEVNIHGGGSSIYGDGMAFWALNDYPKEGAVFGVGDYFRGLGIFIDTYKNERPGRAFPYVMAMKGDGYTKYDAEHDGAANELAGCSARGIHNSDRPTKFRVSYVKDNFLSLEMDIKGKNQWDKCFEVKDIDLGGATYFGFSGQTGELSSNHDLIEARAWGWRSPPSSFAELDEVLNGRVASSSSSSSQQTKKSSFSFFGFLWKSILFMGAVGAAYFGYTVYRANKKRKQEAYYL